MSPISTGPSRRSPGFDICPISVASSSPKLRLKAHCCSSVSGWSRNTSTAYRSIPASIAATCRADSGTLMSMPETSPTKSGFRGW